MSDFDVQSVDLDQLADVASKGGIAALEELANGKQLESPTEAPAEAEATNAGAEDQAADAEPPKEEQPKDDKDHATAVSTKDGKGTIPYSVLKGARERASQFEQENALLRRQIDELSNKLNVPMQEAATVESATVEESDAKIDGLQAKIDALKDDFPELAELFSVQLANEQALRKQLADLQGRYENEQRERADAAARKTADEVQDAIDSNPTLALWQQKAGPEWDAAIRQDNMLRDDPEWAGKSFAERFAKVVEIVKVMRPDAEVVDAATSTEKKPQATPAKRPPVNSLSDIPGGIPPAAGTREQIEELSVAALGNKLMTMSNDQIQDYLSSLGM